MRRYVVVCSVIAGLWVGGSAYGAPRDNREPRERRNPVLKIVKIVKSLGDGIVIPLPPPKP
jgi:hypothetical protein